MIPPDPSIRRGDVYLKITFILIITAKVSDYMLRAKFGNGATAFHYDQTAKTGHYCPLQMHEGSAPLATKSEPT